MELLKLPLIFAPRCVEASRNKYVNFEDMLRYASLFSRVIAFPLGEEESIYSLFDEMRSMEEYVKVGVLNLFFQVLFQDVTLPVAAFVKPHIDNLIELSFSKYLPDLAFLKVFNFPQYETTTRDGQLFYKVPWQKCLYREVAQKICIQEGFGEIPAQLQLLVARTHLCTELSQGYSERYGSESARRKIALWYTTHQPVTDPRVLDIRQNFKRKIEELPVLLRYETKTDAVLPCFSRAKALSQTVHWNNEQRVLIARLCEIHRVPLNVVVTQFLDGSKEAEGIASVIYKKRREIHCNALKKHVICPYSGLQCLDCNFSTVNQAKLEADSGKEFLKLPQTG